MRPFFKNLLLIVATLVVTLIVAEIVIRLTTAPVSRDNFTRVPPELMQSPRYSGIPYSLRQNAEVRQEFGSDPRGYFDAGATLTYHTNNIGFRGPQVDVRKPSGTLRLLGLGDSFTFGTGVRYEDTFLARLESLLKGRGDGPPVQVLNLGVPGYKTANEVETLLANFYTLGADMVVIGFFLNDNGDIPDIMALFNPGVRPWYRASRFVDTMMWRIERRQQAARLVAAYNQSFADGAEGWLETQDALAAARAYSQRFDFELVVAVFPVLWKLSGDYPFVAIHEKVRRYVEGLGVPCLDLQPAFTGHDGPELWVHPNNQHPNEVAHDIAARALYAFLLEQHVLERARESGP